MIDLVDAFPDCFYPSTKPSERQNSSRGNEATFFIILTLETNNFLFHFSFVAKSLMTSATIPTYIERLLRGGG